MTLYSTILADPAWSFKVWNRDTGSGRSAESHYNTMSLEDIQALPINNLAAKDCVLLLWATCPMLPEALSVGQAWGFKFKTVGFSWAKMTKGKKIRQGQANRWGILNDPHEWHIGMGYYSRANVELCLLFTKGHPVRKSKSVRQLIVSPVRAHSQKPDEQYERIEALFEGPYLELFARKRQPGWNAWGNEIQSDITLPIITRVPPAPPGGKCAEEEPTYVPGIDNRFHIGDGNGGTLCKVAIGDTGGSAASICDDCEGIQATALMLGYLDRIGKNALPATHS